jgi:dTDP-4-amino-4,6-dideoxygalactose transaminase
MITVTKAFLPPLEKYQEMVQDIWKSQWLTNNGPMCRELEKKLQEYLGTSPVLFLGNGTIAIQLAIKALGLKGKIITTPFSYVATTSTIVWENCEPVFADIDPGTLNIDAGKIEALIDENTSAILATHCFGNACDIEAIEKIAKKHKLKVIYDAAHCFGTFYKGKSIFNYGDISTTSFHATKLFHTTEGGAVFTPDDDLRKTLSCMRSFGYDGPVNIDHVGINGKNSEFHAAMGLCNLPFVDEILRKRKEQSLYYDELLGDMPRGRLAVQKDCDYNYAYYPVVFYSEELVVRVKDTLEENNIFTRRYFSPSLSSLHYVHHTPTPVSDDIAARILCLPLYHDLQPEDQQRITTIILKVINEYGT